MSAPHRHILRRGEDGYPFQLEASPWPPEQLYVCGDPSALNPGLCVIGSRRATPTGLETTRLFAGWAGAAGYTVISGGAIGCDQAAHRAALESGGVTVVVLAGGADVAYPRSAGDLLAAVARTGAVVSEHPWGAEPKKWTFRTRNRIIAALGAALLVVEAELPSGTFSTADYALEAGREVWAVPGSIHAPESRGPNRLIRMGANPITDVSELAFGLEELLGRPRIVEEPRLLVGDSSGDAILKAVRACPHRPDDLARSLGMDIVTVARRLGAHEAAGAVVRFRDGRYGPAVVASRDTITSDEDEGDP